MTESQLDHSIALDNPHNYEEIRKISFQRSNYNIYQLQYKETIHYFALHRKNNESYFIDSNTGNLFTTKNINTLKNKIMAYERITSKIVDGITIDNFLTVDYIEYILEEFAIPTKSMRKKLYATLQNIPKEKNSRENLTLLDFLGNMDYIQELMMFHLGQPEISENYVRKLDNLIQRLKDAIDISQAPSVFDDNIDMIRILLKYFSNHGSNNIILVGDDSFFVLKAENTFMKTTNIPTYSEELDILGTSPINDEILYLNHKLINNIYEEIIKLNKFTKLEDI